MPFLHNTMTTPIPKNIYHKRLVADSAAKQCDICYRPSTCVLITPDQSDWFYICPGHLKDRGFCSPAGDDGKPKAEVVAVGVGESDAEKEKREKEELRLQVIKEYEEKLARKGKDKDKKGDKEDKDKDKKDDMDKKEEVKDKKEELKKVEPKKEEEPRVFVLHKKIFDRRVLLKRQSFAAKRNLERMKSPGFWPSVPSGLP